MGMTSIDTSSSKPGPRRKATTPDPFALEQHNKDLEGKIDDLHGEMNRKFDLLFDHLGIKDGKTNL